MKKFINVVLVGVKVFGIYFSIFIFSICLLAFEKKVDTPLTSLKLEEYATFLNAKEVTYFQSYYGASHYEVIVEEIKEDEIVTRTLLLVEKYNILEKRFLYLDPEVESLYLVINEDNEIYKERSLL